MYIKCKGVPKGSISMLLFWEGHISRLLFYVGECSVFQKIGDGPINMAPSKEKEKEKLWVHLSPPQSN
jgi:hypothetical protein